MWTYICMYIKKSLDGKYFPSDTNLLKHCSQYTKAIEEKNRFTHMIFPEHCLIGSVGHAVVENIHNAIQEWSLLNIRSIEYVMKGQNCLTEMYSAIEAEIPQSKDPQTKTNMILIDKLCQADKLIICGQALSHCVRYTLVDILKHWKKDKKSIHLLKNCCSSVNTEESIISASNFIKEMESEITVCNDSEVFDI
mmetsp:Transcript_15741/g.15093  ORF Transcript_15741/g.15093 Transcript_15741/m.15093 type:complete len:194 (+) Transcript_15741:357-938(+)